MSALFIQSTFGSGSSHPISSLLVWMAMKRSSYLNVYVASGTAQGIDVIALFLIILT